MAYTVTARTVQLVKTVGIVHAPKMYTGVGTLVAGALTISIPGARRIVSAFASAQSANAAYISATATNTFVITGTSTDTVMWMAFVE